MNQYFGIAAAFKAMAPCLEFVAQGKIVVDLAVEDGPDRAVLVAHRLLAGVKVDNGEAPMAEPTEIVGGAPLAFPVRSSAAERRQHLLSHVS